MEQVPWHSLSSRLVKAVQLFFRVIGFSLAIVNLVLVFLLEIMCSKKESETHPCRSNLNDDSVLNLQKEQVTEETQDWLSLPDEVTLVILGKLDQFSVLKHVQFTCKLWYELCKDPALWKTVHLGAVLDRNIFDNLPTYDLMRLNAVSRGSGHVEAVIVDKFSTENHLIKIAQRANAPIKWLSVKDSYLQDSEANFRMFPSLEVFEAIRCWMFDDEIIPLGRHCPLLHTLRCYPFVDSYHWGKDIDFVGLIAQNLPGLRDISLYCVRMSNQSLEALLDSCNQLESLDLRMCTGLDLKEGSRLLKKLQQLKHLVLPDEHLPPGAYEYLPSDVFEPYVEEEEEEDDEEYLPSDVFEPYVEEEEEDDENLPSDVFEPYVEDEEDDECM